MRSQPGISMRAAEPGTAVKCKCGVTLRTLAPGEAIVGRAQVPRGAVIREEEVECAACSSQIRLRIVPDGMPR